MKLLFEYLYEYFLYIIGNETITIFISTLIVLASLFVVAFIFFKITRKIILGFVRRISAKTTTDWDDILVKHKTFNGLSHYVPASILYFSSNFSLEHAPRVSAAIDTFAAVYFLLVTIFILNALLTSLNEIYDKSYSQSNERPLTGFVQLIKIFLYFIGFLVLVSLIFHKDLFKLFAGMGAMVAVIMLVFKDSILGFVASVQITMNRMIKIGDWVEIPDKRVDGKVIEINLTTVKIQNWDKSIASIPTYSLISESFINWKGMEESGTRRLKRSINIDMNSVRFIDNELMQKLESNQNIQKIISNSSSDIIADPSNVIWNEKQTLTNLGYFRQYLENFLRRSPHILDEMTLIVRHLQPTENGIPLEVILFSKLQDSPSFEKLQADIFDHIIAIIPEFDLRVFQRPTGSDFARSK